jgi:sulfoxide reductase catalytic subunit YedY
MLIKRADDIRSSEITDKKLYLNRREFIGAAAATTAAVAAGVVGSGSLVHAATPAPHGRKLENVKSSTFSTDEKPNKWEEITTYNNYYEFGIDKDSASMFARNLKTEPWTVAIDGECAKKGNMPLEDILKGEVLEDRIYRHRCVEAWSMVIPWVGFPLANLIKKCEPTSKAKYIEFTTFFDTKQMSARTSATPSLCR